MPCPTPAEMCHCAGMPDLGEVFGGDEHRVRRDHLVVRAVREQDRRRPPAARRGARGRPACRRSRRSPAGDRRRRRPTCSAIIVPWLKPTSASLSSVRPWLASSASRKASSTGCALLTPSQRSSGSRDGEPEPLPAHRRLRAGLGRVGRDEGGVGQQGLPLPADLDQVLAVGAVAVQQHDKLPSPGRRACRSRRWLGRSWRRGAVRRALPSTVLPC